MSDLVQRLREEATKCGDVGLDEATGLMREAADEIERLQKFAGAVTSGYSVSEIKEMLRTPAGIAKLKAQAEALANG